MSQNNTQEQICVMVLNGKIRVPLRLHYKNSGPKPLLLGDLRNEDSFVALEPPPAIGSKKTALWTSRKKVV